MQLTKTIVFALLLVSAVACNRNYQSDPGVEILPLPVLKPVPGRVADQIQGYYEALPSNYDQQVKAYPVFVFLHGAGQVGNGSNDLPLLLQEGVTQLLDDKKLPASFTVKKVLHEVLYFSPQFSERFDESSLNTFLNYLRRSYRVDSSRVYIIGMSVGGELACRYAYTYPNTITAVVSMAGGMPPDSLFDSHIEVIASNRIPVWAIHNENDGLVPFGNSADMVSAINLKQSTLSLLTPLPPQGPLGHDAWTRACDASFKVNDLNIYEWALQYRK